MGKIRDKVHFAKVYLFNPTDRIWLDGNLPEIAYSREEWQISGEILEETLDVITKKLPEQPTEASWCFVPHHMIVFCDETGTIVGHVKICFQCSNYRVYPSKGTHSNSIEYFLRIMDKLGVYSEGPSYLVFFKKKNLESVLFNGYKIELPDGINKPNRVGE